MLKIIGRKESFLKYVPLRKVFIQSTIRSFAADVTITEIFQNDTSTPVEVMFYFPVDEQWSIYNFVARIDNREIIIKIKKSNEQPNNENHTNSVEIDDIRQDTFAINIGLLPTGKICIITLSYVTELDFIHRSIIRFTVPINFLPQVISEQTKVHYTQSNPYILEYRCFIEKLYGPNEQQYISRISSPSNIIDIDLSSSNFYVVKFTNDYIHLDRDIILDIMLSDQRMNSIVTVESYAVMAVVTPMKEDNYDLKSHKNQRKEFIFMIDCSQSMKSNNKIDVARYLLSHLIDILPNNSYFNILKFGISYTCLFKDLTVPYNDSNKSIAKNFINKLQADLYGTKLIPSLHWLACQQTIFDHKQQVFLLSDGDVDNRNELFNLCRSLAMKIRIFSFGLGLSPNRSLMKSLARITNGRYTFIPHNANVKMYADEQLRQSIQESITNICVKWNLNANIKCIPMKLSTTYINDRLITYGLTKDNIISLNSNSSVEIMIDKDYYHLNINNLDRISIQNNMILHLGAKALINQLENDELKKYTYENKQYAKIVQCIIELSLKYNILSSHTKFIGIEKISNNEQWREIPVKLSTNHECQLIDNKDRFTSIELPMSVKQSKEQQVSFSSMNNNGQNEQPYAVYITLEPVHSNENINTRFASLTKSQNDQMIVNYLIDLQNADGLWNCISSQELIKDLTGKSFLTFKSNQLYETTEILITAIIILILEVDFSSYEDVWDPVVVKARQHLIHLLNNDWKKLVMLFQNIRRILNE